VGDGAKRTRAAAAGEVLDVLNVLDAIDVTSSRKTPLGYALRWRDR